MTDEPNALHSLYGGASARKALSGNVGGQEREQEVWTPDWIWDVARAALGGRIALDPCAASRPEGWRAAHNVTLPGNGLAITWDPVGTYFNPPYADLEEWLAKAYLEGGRGAKIVGLFPCRPHRRWFLECLRGSTLVFLHYKVVFVGHKNAFPAPLVLAAWNCTTPPLGERETGRWDIPR